MIMNKQSDIRRLGPVFGCLLYGMWAAGAVLAQPVALEEVLVTATKVGETTVQSTPIAITAFSANDLTSRGVDNIRGLIELTPGLQIADINGYAQVYLRGVGSNNVYIGSDPSTTIHMDGVYLARPVGYFSEFLDVERVEVLRGPQGTLYGRNSVGGTINVVSRRPTDTLSGQVRATLGNYSKRSLEAYLSGPLGETGVLGSVSVGRWKRDGYLDNRVGSDFDDQDARAFRTQFLVPINDRAELTLRADYYKADEKQGGASKLLEAIGSPLEDSILGKQWTVTADSPNRLKVRSWGVSADLGYQLNDHWRFKSVTAWRDLESMDRTDADATSMDVTRAQFDLEQHQFSQEINLTAAYDRLQLVTGVYYFREADREPANVVLPTFDRTHFQRPKLEAESYAAFAQGQYYLTDEWSVIVGARYTRETKDYRINDFWTESGNPDPAVSIQAQQLVNEAGFSDPFNISSSKKYNAWTPRFGINYEPSDDLLLYVSATRGFKSGGFDFGSTTPEDQAEGYDPEYLWSYELGMKSQWLDDRLRVNVTAFFYDYKDLQVTLYTPPASAVTQNAATAEVKGIELELQARPMASLDLFLNAAYLDARYDRYSSAQVKAFGAFDASGKRLNNTPRWTVSAGGTWTFLQNQSGNFYVGTDVHYQSTQYFSPVNGGLGGISNYPAQQGDVTLWNARVGWSSADGLWDVIVTGRNLLEKEYITTATDFGGLDLATIVGRPGAPRTYALQVTRSF